jgi:hypothetical protein
MPRLLLILPDNDDLFYSSLLVNLLCICCVTLSLPVSSGSSIGTLASPVAQYCLCMPLSRPIACELLVFTGASVWYLGLLGPIHWLHAVRVASLKWRNHFLCMHFFQWPVGISTKEHYAELIIIPTNAVLIIPAVLHGHLGKVINWLYPPAIPQTASLLDHTTSPGNSHYRVTHLKNIGVTFSVYMYACAGCNQADRLAFQVFFCMCMWSGLRHSHERLQAFTILYLTRLPCW